MAGCEGTRRIIGSALVINLLFFMLLGLGLSGIAMNDSQEMEVLEVQLSDGFSEGEAEEAAGEEAFAAAARPEGMTAQGQVTTADTALETAAAVPAAAGNGNGPAIEETGSEKNVSSFGSKNGISKAGGQAGGQAGGGAPAAGPPEIVRPQIISKVQPQYPERARQRGISGTVVLRVLIGETGLPQEITVAVSSQHPLLDQAAAAALQEWRFSPARDKHSGRLVRCYTTIPISFQLQ